jgi:hypothetical protein
LSIRARRPSADHTHRLARNRPQFGAWDAGAGTNGDSVQCGGCEHRECGGVGIAAQFGAVARQSDTRFKFGVERAEFVREGISDLWILDCLGCRGSDREAAAGAVVTGEINRQLG